MPLKIQGDTLRGVYRRHLIKAPSGIGELDERVYPVTSSDVTVLEVATLVQGEGSLATVNDPIQTGVITAGVVVAGAVGAGSTIFLRRLERGLWSLKWILQFWGANAMRQINMDIQSPSGAVVARRVSKLGASGVATVPSQPWFDEHLFWCEVSGSILAVINVDALAVGENVAINLAAWRAWTDTQP